MNSMFEVCKTYGRRSAAIGINHLKRIDYITSQSSKMMSASDWMCNHHRSATELKTKNIYQKMCMHTKHEVLSDTGIERLNRCQKEFVGFFSFFFLEWHTQWSQWSVLRAFTNFKYSTICISMYSTTTLSALNKLNGLHQWVSEALTIGQRYTFKK